MARIARASGTPLKSTTGRKRTNVDAESARAVLPSTTLPIEYQFVPELVEYCQTP